MEINKTYNDLGQELSKELQAREKEFTEFYNNTVKGDPVLTKCWNFCFAKERERDPDKYYEKWLPLLQEKHISKSDLFHINKLRRAAKPTDIIFYDALELHTIISTNAIFHKAEAEKYGYVIPLKRIMEFHSVFYRSEIDSGYKEVEYFYLPYFIKEYSKTSDQEGIIREDLCLVLLIPPDFQYLQNYLENYTVELFRGSPSSRDITYSNAFLVHEKED